MRRGIVRIDEQTLLDMLGLGPGVVVRAAAFSVETNQLLISVGGPGLPEEFDVVPNMAPTTVDIRKLDRQPIHCVGIRDNRR